MDISRIFDEEPLPDEYDPQDSEPLFNWVKLIDPACASKMQAKGQLWRPKVKDDAGLDSSVGTNSRGSVGEDRESPEQDARLLNFHMKVYISMSKHGVKNCQRIALSEFKAKIQACDLAVLHRLIRSRHQPGCTWPEQITEVIDEQQARKLNKLLEDDSFRRFMPTFLQTELNDLQSIDWMCYPSLSALKAQTKALRAQIKLEAFRCCCQDDENFEHGPSCSISYDSDSEDSVSDYSFSWDQCDICCMAVACIDQFKALVETARSSSEKSRLPTRMAEVDVSESFDATFPSDVTIVFDGGNRVLKAHKHTICAYSQYFWRMFAPSSKFPEATAGSVQLFEDDPDALEALFKWMYWLDYTTALDAELGPSVEGKKSFTEAARAVQKTARLLNLHANVYTVADKYLVENLKNEALCRFKQEVQAGCCHFDLFLITEYIQPDRLWPAQIVHVMEDQLALDTLDRLKRDDCFASSAALNEELRSEVMKVVQMPFEPRESTGEHNFRWVRFRSWDDQ